MSTFVFISPLPRRTPKGKTCLPCCSSPSPTTTCTARRPEWADVVNNRELSELRVGGLAVPRHRWRLELRQRGVHRSVEYVIERLRLDDRDVDSTRQVPAPRRADVIATVRPATRLVPHLDREWPIDVSVGEGLLWSYKRDVAMCAVVCAALSVSVIGGAFFAREFLGIYGIPSESMVPTVLRGDALLVEKVSIRAAPPRRGEVVFFRPPDEVVSVVRRRGGTLRARDLLVKRVAAVAGDRVQVTEDGGVRINGAVVRQEGAVPPQSQHMHQVLTGTFRVEEGYVYLLGDNARASLDSRFWGVLAEQEVVGRPLARIFPPERFSLWGGRDAR